jgi:hypothetical protein
VRIGDRFPEHESFLHLILKGSASLDIKNWQLDTNPVLVFCQALVIATNCHQEEEGIHILKAMNPLLTLGSLAANVKHAVLQRTEIEMGLRDAGGP